MVVVEDKYLIVDDSIRNDGHQNKDHQAIIDGKFFFFFFSKFKPLLNSFPI